MNSLELGGLGFHGDGEAQDSRRVPAGGVDVVAAGRKEAVMCDQLIYRDGRVQRTSGENARIHFSKLLQLSFDLMAPLQEAAGTQRRLKLL